MSVVPKQYEIKPTGVEVSILRSMNAERKENGPNACEVILLANGIKHYAHKVVLISCSDYFRRYFADNPNKEYGSESEKDLEKCKSDDDVISLKSSETGSESSENFKPKTTRRKIQTTIRLPGIKTEELGPILEYMYATSLALRAENVNEILFVGCLLQITTLIKECADVLMKRPSWKSPLVSPELWNFASGRAHDNNFGSETAVTWASNGGRPVSRESTSPRNRGRPHTTHIGENGSRAGGLLSKDPVVASGRVSRKRRYANISESQNRANVYNGTSSRTHNLTEDVNEEFPPPDCQELQRELALHAQLLRAKQYRRRYQQNRSVTYRTAPPPLMDGRNLVESRVEHRRLSGPSASAAQQSHRVEYENPDINQFHRAVREQQPISVFPRISDCNRIFQAAYASALGLPILHPGCANIPLVNSMGRPVYPQSVNNAVNAGENLCETGSAYSPPSSTGERYSASLSAVYATPSSMQEFESSFNSARQAVRSYGLGARRGNNEQFFLMNGLKRGEANGSDTVEIPFEVPYRSGVKRFCPSVIQQQESNFEDDGSLRAMDLRRPEIHVHSKPRDARGIYPSSNSSDVCFSRCSRSERKPVAGEVSSTVAITPSKIGIKGRMHQPNHVDYHKRKRKLLRAAQDIPNNECVSEYSQSACSSRPTSDIVNRNSTDRTNQCSSEDDIIARECHHVDGSDFDSDDSGRPSSV